MRVITQQAEAVCLALKKDDKVISVDILIIISIIISLIQLFMQCNRSAKSALDIMKEPGIFHRRKLRNIIREQLSSHNNEISSAVLTVGRTLTLEQVQNMYSEIKSR